MNSYTVPGLVSVIVASYNHAEYLVERMDSLICQTYQSIEILVIDDCSTDNSIEVLNHYVIHPNVRLIIREQNSGWVSVSNYGVEISRGEYIIFANCDDSCDSEMIQRLVEGFRCNSSVGISYCRSLMINESGKILGDDFECREHNFRTNCMNDTLISRYQMQLFLLHSCVIPNLSAALFSRDCFVKAGGLSPSYRVCSDWDLFFHIASFSDVYYVAKPLNKFRQHQTTIRMSTKERILYTEIVSLLLIQIKMLNLTWFERSKYRLRVMYIWSSHILGVSFAGFHSFQFITKIVLQIDPSAMIYIPPAIILRMYHLLIKLTNKLFAKLSICSK